MIILLKLLGSSALIMAFYFALFRGKSSLRASRVFLLAIPLLSIVFSLVSIEVGQPVPSFSHFVEPSRSSSVILPIQTPDNIPAVFLAAPSPPCCCFSSPHGCVCSLPWWGVGYGPRHHKVDIHTLAHKAHGREKDYPRLHGLFQSFC